MSSRWQNIAVPLVSGLDTSFDEQVTPVAKLRELVNGFFDKTGGISKRPGYAKFSDVLASDEFSTVGTSKALFSRKSELLQVTQSSLYSHLSSRDRWSTVGDCVPMAITTEPVSSDTGNQVQPDVAVNGNLIVYAWDDADDGIVISVFDATGRRVNRFVADAAGAQPRCVAVGKYIHVIWHDAAATPDELDYIRIDESNAATVSSSSAAQLLPDVQAEDWDVQADPSGNYFYVVYQDISETKLKVSKHNPNASQHSHTTCSTAGSYKKPSIAVNDTHLVIGWNTDSTEMNYYYQASNGSLGNSTFTKESVTWAHSLGDVKNLTVGLTTSGNFRVYWTHNTGSNYEENAINSFSGGVFAGLSSGVSPVSTWKLNATVGGKPFTTPSGAVHVPVVTDSGPLKMQNTYLLYADSLSTTAWVPHPLSEGPWPQQWADTPVLIGTFVNGTAADFDPLTAVHVPSTTKVGNKYYLATTEKTQVTAVNSDKYGGTKVKLAVFDYDHKPQSVATNDSSLLASGLLYEYDGGNVVESGFVFWPELEVDYTSTTIGDHADVTEGGGASSMDAGTYGYKIYYEWTNAYGQRQRSTAVSFSVTLAGSLTVTLVVPNLHHTLKQDTVDDVIIVGYRTKANGSLYYRFTSPDPTATGDNGYYINDTSQYSQSVVDSMVDTDLEYNEIDPLTGGVLDHTLPASSQWVAGTDRRVFLAGGTVPESTVYYSKLRNNDDPPEFFDGLSIEIDKKGGAITALAVLNDNLVVFKNNHIFMVGGDGPNNNGFGDFNKPFEVATTVGCNNAHSVVLTDMGLIFQSDKGFYLLQKNYSVAFIGEPAEDYAGQVHTATVIPDDDLVVFLAESGSTLAYDFRRNQWSTYDNHTGLDSVLVGDDYYYINTAGDVLVRTPGSYSDAGSGYSLKLKTAPLRFDGLQNWWRARRLSILGRYHSDHELDVRVWYNREQYWSDDRTYDVSDFISGGTWGNQVLDTDLWRSETNGVGNGNTLTKTSTVFDNDCTAFATKEASGDFTVSRDNTSLGEGSYTFGINATDTIVSSLDEELTHSWLIQQPASGAFVIESNAIAYADYSVNEDDTFSVVRVGTEVRYLHNGVTVYTSAVSSSGTVYLGAHLAGTVATPTGQALNLNVTTGFEFSSDYVDSWGSDSVWGGSDTDYQVQHRFGRQKVQSVTVEISEKRPTERGFTVNELALEYAFKSGLGRIGKTRKS